MSTTTLNREHYNTGWATGKWAAEQDGTAELVVRIAARHECDYDEALRILAHDVADQIGYVGDVDAYADGLVAGYNETTVTR